MVALRRVFVAFRQRKRKRRRHIRLYHAGVHVFVSSSPFLLGQTLHAHEHSYYYLFWLRVKVQKATLSLVTSLRLMTHTHRPMREESASSFVHELHKVVQDALPLYVTPSLENSLVRSLSRWKTGSQRGHRFDRLIFPGATIWKRLEAQS